MTLNGDKLVLNVSNIATFQFFIKSQTFSNFQLFGDGFKKKKRFFGQIAKIVLLFNFQILRYTFEKKNHFTKTLVFGKPFYRNHWRKKKAFFSQCNPK